jgi:hypothetical protein
MNDPTVTAKPDDVLRRIALVEDLRAAGEGVRARRLAPVVQEHLLHLWEHGGRRGATKPGRQPERILVRPEFMVGRPNADPGPAMSRLIRSKGLQLRLELLMLFDAQCRYGPGTPVRNVRQISPRADERYTSWRELVLTANKVTAGTDRGPGDLRARQIAEALQALQTQHLMEIPMTKGGNRRRYDDLRLLAESSTAEAYPRYTVPERGVAIPRQFFTNLWVFALTDTELATYLTLALMRHNFPGRHTAQGIHLSDSDRRASFRLTRAAWRSTSLLHRFGLIDRQHDGIRSFATGKIGNVAERLANNEVMPVKYKINDAALEQAALDVIHQVLTAPTMNDYLRHQGLSMIVVPPGP